MLSAPIGCGLLDLDGTDEMPGQQHAPARLRLCADRRDVDRPSRCAAPAAARPGTIIATPSRSEVERRDRRMRRRRRAARCSSSSSVETLAVCVDLALACRDDPLLTLGAERLEPLDLTFVAGDAVIDEPAPRVVHPREPLELLLDDAQRAPP